LVTALLLGAAPTAVHADDPGLTVLNFLKIGVGARPEYLGGAYVALTADATATYWNPAGLLAIERNDVQGTHNGWIQDLRQEFVGLGLHRGRHAFGLSFIGLYTEDIEARDSQGNYDGKFGFSDHAFSLSYAFQLSQSLGLGGTARYVRESIIGAKEEDFNLSGFAFDLGATWWTPLRGVTAAAALRNLGGQVSYDLEGSQKFDLPSLLQAGLAYQHANVGGGGFTATADVLSTRGDDVSVRGGVEYAYRGQFLLGAGYKSGYENENVSFGLGYRKKIRAFFAYTPIYNDLGDSYRITLGYAW
jgi:hypothetical protein